MTGMPIPKGAVYVLTITARVCECPPPHVVWATGKVLERVIERAVNYYAVYETFFGDQLYWLDFAVVDCRDGSLAWLNGRAIERSGDAAFHQHDQ